MTAREIGRSLPSGVQSGAVVQDLEDPRRTEPSMTGLGEREMLEAWLEFHRATLLLKTEGLDDEARKARPIVSSALSIHGLVRHMAEVERSWFRRTLLRERDAPYICYDPAVEDSDLYPLDEADWVADLAAWQAECDASRQAAAAVQPRRCRYQPHRWPSAHSDGSTST